VAVCGGAGDDLLDEIDADVYVTSDLRHHVASEYLATDRAALIDVPHAAAEAMWLEPLAERVRQAFPDLVTDVYPGTTDPWDGCSG
jgi:putative NIF3 family GTP cyclohydrolase 1 type 2